MSIFTEYSEQFRASYFIVGVRLAVILATAWILGPVISSRLKISDDKRKIRAFVIFASVVAWIVFFGVGMLRHLSFHSKAWDLAIFDQVIWNLSNGHGWECSVRGVHDLRGDHFEPILLIFVPLYKLFPNVAWLLGIQAAALIGAGLLIRSAYAKQLNETVSFFLLLAFLFYPPLHWLVLADFHPIALAAFFIVLAWLGARREDKLVWLIGLVGLALCGEEGLIVGGWWGLCEFFSSRIDYDKNPPVRSRSPMRFVGLIVAFLFWIFFVYLIAVYIPGHRAEGEGYFYTHRYSYLGRTVGDIAVNLFMNPRLWLPHLFNGRSLALLALFLVPLALLPLRKPGILILLIPTALYTLLSESPEQKSIFHQYVSMWIPFLFIATAEALASYGQSGGGRISLKAASTLLVASILALLSFSPIFGLSMHPELLTPESWAGEAKGVIRSIGPDTAISAPSALCPHLSHRRVLLLQPKTGWPGAGQVVVLPEFPPPQNQPD